MKKIFFLLLFIPFFSITECFSQDENRRTYSVSCSGTTKKGTICKNKTYCNNGRCFHHGGNCYNNSSSDNSFNSRSVIKLPIKTVAGMKYISINISGVYYDFLIDSGASDMLINSEVEKYLLNNRKINKSNYIQKYYITANGSKMRLNTTTISSIVIGGKLFKNLKVAIGDQEASLLLGMSFLNQYDWKFKGNYLELRSK
tara:strand:- start:521 stop:1120 length:600 start_codon:yes stop_codon:yes gene_type:complete